MFTAPFGLPAMERHKRISTPTPLQEGDELKRVSALLLISSLAFLGACSSDSNAEEKGAESAQESSSAPTDPNVKQYELASGETVEVKRLDPLPENVLADVQSRFDTKLYEPDITAYNKAVEEGSLSESQDNYAAFKTLSTEVGADTGKYVAGVIRVVADCDSDQVVTWAFASQSTSAAQPAPCNADDALAAARQSAEDYVESAMGGPEAWIIIEQDAK
ncbi:hypothetical protein [Jonesia quinghaiensis]|uniref:hypothetical protein n=1 Tax=Jonesia quinghaiensis TaxID=262806 RepID=UPI00048F6DC5|nr:hypothetical protein [Jonesia quinghaiensis]